MGIGRRKKDYVNNIDRPDWHGQHSGGGTVPSGTDGQTLRYDEYNVIEATSDLTSHSDGTGASIAVDNDTEGVERIRNIVKVQEGNAIPLAADTYQGTILVIHKAP